LRELTVEEDIRYSADREIIMRNIQKGEYVWIWYSRKGTEGSERVEGFEIDSSGGNEGTFLKLCD
jgi:hypothetical protein